MKKVVIIIIIIIVTVIIVSLISTHVFEEPFILDGPGMVMDPRTLTTEEWKQRISDFYDENYGYIPEKITYEENEPNIVYITIYHNAEMTDDYILDTQTGIASSSTQKTVNFFRGEFVEDLTTKVNFENNECIAVGYIEKGKEAQIIEKYFYTDDEYEYLTTVVEGDEYQFLVIPKKIDAKLKVWKYNVSEEGELYFDELLAEVKGTPLLIKTQNTEIFPRVGIVYELDETTFTIQLMISGMNGKLIFNDYKSLIKDISIY